MVLRLAGARKYFVEVGAADGVRLSNTYLLEKDHGWRGLLVEPGPQGESLATNRTAVVNRSCVWSVAGSVVKFKVDSADTHFSGIESALDRHRGRDGDTVLMVTNTLTNVLRATGSPRAFAYLSLDTEGSELAVLRGLDFAAFQPRIITVEHNRVEPRRSDIRELLDANGYQRFARVEWDDWYALTGSLSRAQRAGEWVRSEARRRNSPWGYQD